MVIEINALFASKIGFASHQNAVPVLRDLQVTSRTRVLVQDLSLSLKADPPFLPPKTSRIDRVAAGATLRVNDRDLSLNTSFLNELSESVRGDRWTWMLRADDRLRDITSGIAGSGRMERLEDDGGAPAGLRDAQRPGI